MVQTISSRIHGRKCFWIPLNFNRCENFINFHWFTENLVNSHRMNRIYRLWKCGCLASKLPVCKQLHGKVVPLTTTSAIIDLTIIAVLRKVLQHGDCANRHGLPVVTHRQFFLALEICRQQPADSRNNTRHKRGVATPHSADTQTNRPPHQLPYQPIQVHIYVIVFSTSTRVMEMNYFINIYNFCF